MYSCAHHIGTKKFNRLTGVQAKNLFALLRKLILPNLANLKHLAT